MLRCHAQQPVLCAPRCGYRQICSIKHIANRSPRIRPRLLCEAKGSDSEDEAAPGVPLRVERLLANLGYGKRRECATLIKQGRLVYADTGAAAKVGQKATAAEVLLDGEPLDPPAPLVVLLHKPVGYAVTSPDDENVLDPKVYDLLPYRFGQRRPFLSAVGRLDKETSGLLVLTDDGQLVHRMKSPRMSIWKRYRVSLDKPLVGKEAAAAARRFASGALQLVGDRSPLLPAGLTMVDDVTAEVALCEGRYHQIRRMFASLGYEVRSLHRHTIGSLTLGDTREGDWRFCTAEDLAAVFGGPQVDPAAGVLEGDTSSSSSSCGNIREGSTGASSSSSSSKVIVSSSSGDGGRSSSSSSSRQKASSRRREALAAGQLGEELVVDAEYDVEDEDGVLQQEQQRTSKRYRDSTRFKQRRATLKQRLAAAGGSRDP